MVTKISMELGYSLCAVHQPGLRIKIPIQGNQAASSNKIIPDENIWRETQHERQRFKMDYVCRVDMKADVPAKTTVCELRL